MMSAVAPQPTMPSRRQPRPFTGRHMTIILVTFFAVVIGVNVLMARFAVSSFGGTVVDNSYVASQNFNDWLAEARAQKALGWSVTVDKDRDGRAIVDARDAAGRMFPDGRVTAIARHPLGRLPDRTISFTRGEDGRFVADQRLDAGRWTMVVTVVDGGHTFRLVHDWS